MLTHCPPGFDRLTFDPVNNWEDTKYLRSLRAVGSRRRFQFTGRHHYRDTPMGWGKHYFYPEFGWWRLASGYFFCVTRTKQEGKKYCYDTHGRTFVDMGCGNSADAAFATTLGMTAYGIDLFPPSKPHFPYRPEDRFTFIQADMVETIPLKPESVDYALCAAVLDLIRPHDRLLFYRNVYDCLKPQGHFVVTTQKLRRGWGIIALDEVQRLGAAGFRIYSESFSNRILAIKP